jgi:hypothetical protein
MFTCKRDLMTAQEIYDDIKKADNKKLWAYAQELAEFQRKNEKSSELKDSLDGIDFNDTDKMRQIVFEHLLAESGRGNAQASDKLGKYLGLEQEKQKIIIQVVDFADAYREDNNTTPVTT